ncbi:MAG: DHA2 family efflux MFS transporter permease subunit [Desulfovibrio sp.]|jgi:DHA2 family multidrug resistance protein|nr:DHA2 family efflux MFS transporter permease subunit [Desulfovibrio sp.]
MSGAHEKGLPGTPSTGPPHRDETHPPLQGAALALLTFALPLATFMQVLDTTIANVSVPTIAGNLGASGTQGTWIITSYAVANAVALPASGRLARRLGEVRLFLWSTALFTLSSLLCGLAEDLSTLVFFRVIQGAVGGPMMPLAQSLLLNNYPPEKRNSAIALWSMTVSVAPIFGPVLGGYISDNFHWGWIFFINVPFGGIVLFLAHLLLRDRETPLISVPVSAIGIALLVLGVGAFQMTLDRGKELDWFNSTEIVVSAAVAVVGITFLVAWELTDKHPTVSFSLLGSRNFCVGVILISLGMMLYLGTVVLLPLLLQTQFGYTAASAGLATAPIGIFPVFIAPFVGKYAHRVDLRILITAGFLVFAGCMQARALFSPQADLNFILIPQIIQGIAVALFFVPITTLAFADLPPQRMADAAGLFNFIRTLFGAVGASAAATLWERREAFHHSRLTSHIDPYNPIARDTLETLQSLGMTGEQSAAWLAGAVTKQGFIFGAAEIYQLCAAAFLIMVIVVWTAKSGRQARTE